MAKITAYEKFNAKIDLTEEIGNARANSSIDTASLMREFPGLVFDVRDDLVDEIVNVTCGVSWVVEVAFVKGADPKSISIFASKIMYAVQSKVNCFPGLPPR